MNCCFSVFILGRAKTWSSFLAGARYREPVLFWNSSNLFTSRHWEKICSRDPTVGVMLTEDKWTQQRLILCLPSVLWRVHFHKMDYPRDIVSWLVSTDSVFSFLGYRCHSLSVAVQELMVVETFHLHLHPVCNDTWSSIFVILASCPLWSP